jgi:hypothetical protein
MLTVAEVRILVLAENQDAIAVFSFAIIGLLASLLLATAFSWSADMAEALPPLSLLAISVFVSGLTELVSRFPASLRSNITSRRFDTVPPSSAANPAQKK